MKLNRSSILLVTALVLSVTLVTSASAWAEDTFRSDASFGKATYFAATAESAQVLKFTPGDTQEVICGEVEVEGTMNGPIATELTLVPEYGECGVYNSKTTKEELVASISFESCDYLFENKTSATEGGTEGKHAKVQLECDKAEDHVEIRITALNLACISLPEQEMHGVRYAGQATEGGLQHIVIDATAHGIESTTTGSCGEEVHGSGAYVGEIRLFGFQDEAHEVPTDVWVEGESEEHHFISDSATGVTHLTAEATSEQKFVPSAEEPEAFITCDAVNISGEFEGDVVTELTVEPTYDECQTEIGSLITVTTNGCHYLFKGATTETVEGEEVAGGDHGTLHIACPGEESVEIDTTFLNLECIAIGPQTVHGVHYEESEQAIVLEATAEGIKSQTTGPCGEGTHTGGTYTGTVAVTGYEDSEHKEQVDLDLTTTEP